jgi:hypothetical protein
MSVVSIPAIAAAEEATDTPAAESLDSEPAQAGSVETGTTSKTSPAAKTEPVVPPPSTPADPAGLLEGWKVEAHGYFRAPMALGISSRPNPDQMNQLDSNGNKLPDGPSHLQLSYGPNRTMDWSYYSFAYTRLQEQDWAEMTFHAKKKHVDAAIGWMGYWLAASGFRDPDAAATPGVASLTLDSDFEIAGITPNIALQMGAWWPGFGYFEKYDTFTLGRFRQIGEQLKLTIPLNPDLTVTLVEGFGTGRDGSFRYGKADTSALYATIVGANLVAYANAQVNYKDYANIGLHYNREWTRDPYLTAQASASSGKAYSDVAEAYLSVFGAEANVRAPYAGRFWLSPSVISVKNGWALAGQGGTEVMHSQGGMGIATNYLAWTGSPPDSTGSGSMLNLGFLWEDTLSSVLGKAPGEMPEVTWSVFGLLAKSSLDLPAGTQLKQDKINQFKWGVDATLQALSWLAIMLRYDTVNYDLDHPGFIFSAITSRLAISSHYLSGESIYLQYSRYRYGDNMLLAGKWDWNTPLVAGADVVQGNGGYSGQKPDENVVKLQAQIVF